MATDKNHWQTSVLGSSLEEHRKIRLLQTEGSRPAGIVGAGSAIFVDRITTKSDVDISSLPSTVRGIANAAATVLQDFIPRYASAAATALKEDHDQHFDARRNNSYRLAGEIMSEMSGSLGGTSFLWLGSCNADLEVYSVSGSGSLVLAEHSMLSSIGSGSVALSAWQKTFALHDDFADLLIDALCVYECGLDVGGVGGSPTIAIISTDSAMAIPSNDGLLLTNLSGLYLAGGLKRTSLKEGLAKYLSSGLDALSSWYRSFDRSAHPAWEILSATTFPLSFWSKWQSSSATATGTVGPLTIRGDNLIPANHEEATKQMIHDDFLSMIGDADFVLKSLRLDYLQHVISAHDARDTILRKDLDLWPDRLLADYINEGHKEAKTWLGLAPFRSRVASLPMLLQYIDNLNSERTELYDFAMICLGVWFHADTMAWSRVCQQFISDREHLNSWGMLIDKVFWYEKTLAKEGLETLASFIERQSRK